MDFFQLGTRNSRIKQLNSSSQFSISEQELLFFIEEVQNVKLQSDSTDQSNGTRQGYKKCLCKTVCDNKNYASFKRNMLYNSGSLF